MANPHKLVLGLKPNPTFGVDDCIDIGGASAGLGGGNNYQLVSFDLGKVEEDYKFAPSNQIDSAVLSNVSYKPRTMSFTIQVTGDKSISDDKLRHVDMMNRIAEINRFLSISKNYYSRYNGSPPGEMLGLDGTGEKAVLTVLLGSYKYPTYFDVLAGSAVIKSDLVEQAQWGICQVTEVEVTIITQPFGYGDNIYLFNMCSNGDFESYNGSDSLGNMVSNWTLGSNNFGLDHMSNTGAGFGVVRTGQYSLYYIGPAGASGVNTTKSDSFVPLFTPISFQSLLLYNNKGDKIYATGWVHFNQAPSTNGGIRVKLAMRNTAGGETVVATIFSVDNTTPPPGFASWATATGKWIKFGLLYTVQAADNGKYPIFYIECPKQEPSTFIAHFDDMALWKNPPNDTEPVEYISYGGNNNIPEFSIRGIRGEVDTPCTMHLYSINPVGDVFGGFTHQTKNNEQPLDSTLVLKSGSGTVQTDSNFWGGKAVWDNSGSNNWLFTRPLNLMYDYKCRRYKVYGRYALNGFNAANYSQLITSLTLYGPSNSYFNLRTDLPPTYTGASYSSGPSGPSDYRVAYLGEIFFSEPNVPWNSLTPSYNDTGVTLSVKLPTSVTSFGLDVLLLVPSTDGFVGIQSSNTGSNNLYEMVVSDEGSVPSGGASMPKNATMIDYQRFDNPYIKGKLLGFNLYLRPKAYTKGAIFSSTTFRSTGSELYDFGPTSNVLKVAISYCPRYRYLRTEA